MTLREAIIKAQQLGVAIGHFNFAESTVFNAIVEAAKELNVPVILGTSEKEGGFLGEEFLRDVIARRSPTATDETISQVSQGETEKIATPSPFGGNQKGWARNDGGGRKIFFNSDHTKSLEGVKKAVELGYDSIIFDGSDLPLEENIKRTKEIVEYIRTHETQLPDHPKILIEGEIGFIGSGSELRDKIPDGIQLTTPEEAVRFVQETGVDMLAPAVGNVHGIIKSGEPKLDIERIAQIHKMLREAQHDTPLVLHGASGNSDEDIRAAIKAGISVVHINTEIRAAWRNALAKFLGENQNEIAPYKILAASEVAAKEVIKQKLKLFNGL